MSSTVVLLRLVRFTGRYFALDLAFAFIMFVGVPLLTGLATLAFFSNLTGHATISLGFAVVFLAALQAVGAISGVALLSPWSSMQQKAHVLLRRNLVAAMLRGYGRHGLNRPPGDIVSRFRGEPVLIADVLDALCDLIGRSSFAVAAGVVMFQVNPLITVVVYIPLAVSALIIQLLGERIRSYREAARVASGRLSAYLADVLAGHLAIKVAGATPHIVTRLDELGHARRRAEVRDSVFGSALEAFNINFGNLGTALVLLLAAPAMASHRFSVADLALFVVYLDALNWFPEEVGRLLGGLKQIDVSLGRMQALVPDEPAGSLALDSPVCLHDESVFVPSIPARDELRRLEVCGLTYRHNGDVHAIHDVSFVLERGTLTVVTGPIGSGKTTLLNVLLGLLPPDAGTVTWNSEPVEDLSAFFVPPQAAYTPQTPRLFSETVRENILLGWPAGDGELDDAVAAGVLEPDLASLVDGLDTQVGPRGVILSGGQVQRVAAARMFVRQAELMVFDDLSSALDARTEAQLWERLADRAAGETYLVVSHRPALLRRADQILELENGRLKR